MESDHNPIKSTGLLKPDSDAQWAPNHTRCLSSDTLRRFGTFTAGFKGQAVRVMPVYDKTGRLVMQKLKMKDKSHPLLKADDAPDMKLTDAWLYGRHVWGDKHDKRVVIFTGEDDAHSAAEVTKFKFPCVSVINGDQGAVANIKANYKWLDRFGEIVLFFDNDESGQSIIEECASLFDGGKVKIAKMEAFKDASEAKQANRPGDIEQAIYSASAWSPKGIVNARDGLEAFLADGLLLPSWPYPWRHLQDATRGMRRGEISLHLGGTGIAKTTLMYHYAQHLLRWDGRTPEGYDADNFKAESFPVKMGWLGFEDTLRSIKIGLMSIHAARRLQLEPLPLERTRELYIELFGDGQLEVYDAETAEYGIEAVIGYIKYMVRALGCHIIFIDPLSFLVSMIPPANRTAAEESLAGKFAALAKQLNCHFHITHHLKKAEGTPFEEGGEISLQDAKGAGAWYQYASTVIGYERDQQGPRPDLLRTRLLKVRLVGGTGVQPQSLLAYDKDTGVYSPTNDTWPTDDKDTGSKDFGSVGTESGY